ncbi:MAG: phage baseplate plug family protein [Janthinobacterium lividum]
MDVTATAYEIPLVAAPQTLTVRLGSLNYGMRLIYRGVAGWVLDLSDALGNVLVAGIPLVTGADLLAPYPNLAIGGALYVQTDGDPAAVPGFADLGDPSRLFFVTP